MIARRTELFKEFCRVAGVEEGTLRINYSSGLTIGKYAKLADLVSQTTGGDGPGRWSKEWMVVEHISPDDAAHIVAEIEDESTQAERWEKGISVEFEVPGWVKPLTILPCFEPFDVEGDE